MSLARRILAWLESVPASRFLLAVFLIHTLLHLRYLDLPPVGFHQWRQTQTLAVARNFHEEGMSFLRPRVDGRGSGSGVTGMEFPIVSYTVALGYRLFGERDAVHRVTMLIFGALTLIACYRFSGQLLRSRGLGAIATLALLFSPLFVYYSSACLPDLPSLALFWLGLSFLPSYSESRRVRDCVVGWVALTLGFLVKLSGIVALPFAAWVLATAPVAPRLRRHALASIGLSVMVVATWYAYARHLSAVSGLHDFRLDTNFPYSIALVPGVLRKVFVQWLPEVYVNYAAFPFLCVGCYAASRQTSLVRGFLVLYSTAFALYAVMFLPMFDMHDYYAIPILPVLVLLVAIGFGWLVEAAEQRRWVGAVVALLLVAMPILGAYRGLSRLEQAERPADMMTIASHLDHVIPDRRSRIVAALDPSPSVYLYFMHRKGWVVAASLSESQLVEMEREGARFLVSSSRELESQVDLRAHLRPISEHGRFRIFALR